MDVIVKFKGYRAILNFLKGRKYLRENNINIYLNESLTKTRSKILYECRQLKQNNDSPVVSAWSHDGNIYVKNRNDVEPEYVASVTWSRSSPGYATELCPFIVILVYMQNPIVFLKYS